MSSAKQVSQPSNINKLKEMYKDLVGQNRPVTPEEKRQAGELIEGLKLLKEIRQPLRKA